MTLKVLELFGGIGACTAALKRLGIDIDVVDYVEIDKHAVASKGSTILDCFNGSGSTGKAVMFENKERGANYKYIGIELTDEYLPIAKARIDYVENVWDFSEELKTDEGTFIQSSLFDEVENG